MRIFSVSESFEAILSGKLNNWTVRLLRLLVQRSDFFLQLCMKAAESQIGGDKFKMFLVAMGNCKTKRETTFLNVMRQEYEAKIVAFLSDLKESDLNVTRDLIGLAYLVENTFSE